MRKRALRALIKDEGRLVLYGRNRASGSKTRRRGRRAILRAFPGFKDHSSMPIKWRLAWIKKELELLKAGKR